MQEKTSSSVSHEGTPSWKERLASAQALTSQGQFEEAAKAYDLFTFSGNPFLSTLGYTGNADILLKKGNPLAALPLLKSALSCLLQDKNGAYTKAAGSTKQHPQLVAELQQKIAITTKAALHQKAVSEQQSAILSGRMTEISLSAGQYDLAIDYTLEQIEIMKRVGRSEQEIHQAQKNLAATYHSYGRQLYGQQEYAYAGRQFFVAWCNYIQLNEPELAAGQCLYLGQAYEKCDDLEEAVTAYKTAKNSDNLTIKSMASISLAIVYSQQKEKSATIFKELLEGLKPFEDYSRALTSPNDIAQLQNFVRDSILPHAQSVRNALRPEYITELNMIFRRFNLEYEIGASPSQTTASFVDRVAKTSGDNHYSASRG